MTATAASACSTGAARATTRYPNLLRVSRWTAVVAGVFYAVVHSGTLQKKVDAEKKANHAAPAHGAHH